MTELYQNYGKLRVATPLANFVNESVLPVSGLDRTAFWEGASDIFARFAPQNAALLMVRDAMQSKIDVWHDEHAGLKIDQGSYQAFLAEIGYLVAEPAPFSISPTNVDAEVATLAGPQLVVPILNARFLLNAANARWGSLYDALYGTDAIPGTPAHKGYDEVRGRQVIAWAKNFLDRVVPLANGSWTAWAGASPELAQPAQLVGRAGANYLLSHNGLHIELVIDRAHAIGRDDPAGLADVVLESALSTIADLEDSIAAVDAEDKVAAYANWLGLMNGSLEADFVKDGSAVKRRLASDRCYTAADGSEIVLPGRSLMFVRNVGHLMTTPAILLEDGNEAPEGILDCIMTSLIACQDIRGNSAFRNSRAGSIYIVKPKMHGPHEADFTNCLFDAVEDLLRLDRHTIKVGLMDEERRTSANLAACIAALRNRIVFINTGFLDRTGDEMHTSMRAGAMLRKGDMKASEWITAYEDRNVQIGLACGFSGKAQIGKGMWAAPDRMADMMQQKISHPKAGANTAWVPSPTAATLHATHYHDVDVFGRQAERHAETVAALDKLLTMPLMHGHNWSTEEVREELDNNVQGILGYVVRWVDQGIGCSKVPDIHDIGLMEDRATLRISSQHIANWILHGVTNKTDVDAAFVRMAAVVDTQNMDDPFYDPMSKREHESLAFMAAKALVFGGLEQPNGYTEPLLHCFRKQLKEHRPALR